MLFSLLVLLHFQASILQISLSSHMLQGYSVGMTVVLSVTKLLAYLALIHFHKLTLTNAILADTLGYGLMYAGLHIAHARYCTPRRMARGFSPQPAERRRLFRYSFFNNFNDAGTLLLTSKSDNFFIAALMNPVAVGTYAFYGRLNEMASQLLPSRLFSNVIQPVFFAVPANEAKIRIPRYFSFILNLANMVQLPMVAYAIAFHAEIVTVLFGGKYLDSSWLLPIIVGFATVGRMGEPVRMVAQYQEKASLILLSKVFGIYNLVAILVLVPIAGVYGAAIATGSAQAMKTLYLWWHVRDMARWTNFRAVLNDDAADLGQLHSRVRSVEEHAGYAALRASACRRNPVWSCGSAVCAWPGAVAFRSPDPGVSSAWTRSARSRVAGHSSQSARDVSSSTS